MSRIVLNDSSNLQNVVDKDDLKDVTLATLAQLTKQLLSISGPHARNSFILYNSSTLNDGLNTDITGSGGVEVFTRDGIHCLSNIAYMSPLQRYIKDQLLAFMGRRVDACCGDGTTTSMIFTASFVANMMKRRDKLTQYSITEIERAFKAISDVVIEKLADLKITKEDLVKNHGMSLQDAAKLIAYCQAYTASSGKMEVAAAIGEIFKHTPEVAWDYAIKQKYPYRETADYKVVAEEDAFEGIFDVDIITPELCNIDLGRYYQRENVNLLIMRTGMLVNSNCITALVNFFGRHIEEKTDPGPMVILIPSQARSHDSNLMNGLLETVRKHGFEVFIAAYQRPMGYPKEYLYSMDAISAKADVPPFTELTVTNQDAVVLDPFLIKCDVKIDHYNCYLNNVTKYHDCCTEEDRASGTHPGEKYPEAYPNYVEWRDFFMRALEDEATKGDKALETVQKDLNNALMTMSLLRSWHISIGGKSHDQNTIVHILDDAAKSALAAVKHGIYLNGPQKFLHVMKHMSNSVFYTGDDKTGMLDTILTGEIIEALCAAAQDMAFSIFGERAPYIYDDGDWPFRHCSLTAESYQDFYQQLVKSDCQGMRNFTYLTCEPEYVFRDDPSKSIGEQFNLVRDKYFTAGDEYGYPEYEQDLHNSKVTAPPCQVGNLFDVVLDRLREVALRFVFTDNLIAIGTVWDSKIETK